MMVEVAAMLRGNGTSGGQVVADRILRAIVPRSHICMLFYVNILVSFLPRMYVYNV